MVLEAVDHTLPANHFRILPIGSYCFGTMPFDSDFQWEGIVLLLCLDGEVTIRISGQTYELYKNRLCCVMPLHVAELHPSDSFRVAAVAFTFELLADFPLAIKPDLADRMTETPCVDLTDEQVDIFTRYHELLYLQYCRREHPSRVAVIQSLVFSLLAEVGYTYSFQGVVPSRNRQEKIVNELFSLLHAHHCQHKDASFYAEKICLTPKYLSHVVKQVTGRTLYDWITFFVMKDAKRLLQATDLNVSEIADRLGFSNSSFFGRYFKKNAGMTPLAFRQATLNER